MGYTFTKGSAHLAERTVINLPAPIYLNALRIIP